MHDPTTLPDTGSVNKFAHNYSVFQTRVLQKLGKACPLCIMHVI